MLCVEVSAMLLVIFNRGVGCMFKRLLLSALCAQKDIQEWTKLVATRLLASHRFIVKTENRSSQQRGFRRYVCFSALFDLVTLEHVILSCYPSLRELQALAVLESEIR